MPWRRRARDQHGDASSPRRRAPKRRAKTSDADDEHAPAADAVAEPAADEDERAEDEEVGVRHPLQAGEIGAEPLLDRGQRDVDDRAVDEGHRRGDDGGGEDERPRGRRRRSRVHSCGGPGQAHRRGAARQPAAQVLDQPAAGAAGRAGALVDDVDGKRRSDVGLQRQRLQPAGGDVLAHHVDRHVAPAEAGEQEFEPRRRDRRSARCGG